MADVAASVPAGELVPSSLVDLAVARLRREILTGQVPPGERLIEEQLTRRFGISRAPLREALRLLAQQGLLEHLPRRGVRVATMSDRDVAELYDLRDCLERYAVSLAVPLPAGTAPTGLAEALQELRVAARAGDGLGAADAHHRFHLELVGLAGQHQLALVYEPVLVKIRICMAMNLTREAQHVDAMVGVARHERLYGAVVAGDRTVVLRELEAHGARRYLS